MTNDEVQEIIDRAEDEYDRLKDRVHEQYDEIERLNNIINELEKWLEEKIDEYAINLEYLSEERMFSVKRKLQELKGSDKE